MSPAKTVDTYLARQAIFDRSLSVVGYELYFRTGVDNLFPEADPDQATYKVVEGALNTFGLGRLTGAKRGFFNCTRSMLTQNFVTLLPARSTVLEILPAVPADEAVVSVCRGLKKQGYQIAMDDFTSRTGGPLVPLADILKVDFQALPADERQAIVRRHGRPGVQLLAKKLGARKELTEAMEMGYQLYQGFFFCRPEMISRKEVPAYKLNYLNFLREVNRPEADFDALEKIIRQDVTLSLKLLRYVNSAMLGLRSRVDSIRQAMTLLGLNMIRRWVSLLALAAMSDDKPGELVVTSLARGRFCELAGAAAGFKDNASDLFMIGMLSIIDAILDRPMLEVLSDLPVSDAIKGALMGKPEGMGRVLSLAVAYEHAEWDRLPPLIERLGIDVMKVPQYYRDAITWTEDIFRIESPSPARQ